MSIIKARPVWPLCTLLLMGSAGALADNPDKPTTQVLAAATDKTEVTADVQLAPEPSAIEAFPEYPVSQQTERQLAQSPAEIAAIILDYPEQCKTCRHLVASVVAQEVFERDQRPYQFYVWQDVNKEIGVLVGKIPFRSSSWTEVRVFESGDGDTIIIDSRLLDPEHAEVLAETYERPSKPAFALLHSRWTISAQKPGQDGQQRSVVKGIVGGKGQGVANLVPSAVMRKELTGVMEETLDFVAAGAPAEN